MHRFVASVMSTRVGAWLAYHLAQRLDRGVSKLSKGRATVSGWAVGVPPVWVTTTGAKSGLKRRTPLFGIPFGDDGLGLVGTSMGQAATPSWVFNLSANPDCEVSLNGSLLEARARLASGDEEDEIWDSSFALYPGFREYRQRVTNRTVGLFVLEPR